MFSFSLKKNLVFNWNDAAYRIDRLQPNAELLVEQLATAQLSIVSSETLLAEYSQGKISVEPPLVVAGAGAPAYSRPLSELPEEIRIEVARRLLYVEAVLGRCEQHSSAKWVRRIISEVAAELNDPSPPSKTTAYRWCRRYLIYRDTRALIPRTDRRGRHSSLAGKVLELLAEATEEAFAVSPQATGATVYSRLIAKIDEINKRSPAVPALRRPSERTVYRHLHRLDEYDKVYLREGKRLANARFRLVKSSVTTSGILERVEVDHTPLDLFLVDERSWIPLGRPTLSIAIDHFSRMPLGYYLSFGHPSTVAVLGTLRHAILPKNLAAQVIPNLSIQHAWPCYGLFATLVLDNGLEFHSTALESIAFDLSFRLQFCPKKEPRFKGVVERYLKTINYSFASQFPGASFARLHLRKDYDPQKHAVLTLAEFTQIFEKWVVDVYAQTLHRGIGTTPCAKWHEGMNRQPLTLPASLQALQQRVGIDVQRALRHDGIVIDGVRYRSDALSPILMAHGAGVRVKAMVDPDDLGTIQVWGPQDQEPVCVPAVDQCYAAGLTYAQHKIIRAHVRAEGLDTQNSNQLEQAKIEIARTVEQLMQSRKQSSRRKAAMIRDLNAERPNHQMPLPNVPAPATPRRRNSRVATSDHMPTPSYTTYKLNHQKD